ncbi:hypothetical protein BGX38DRAFT_1334093, partial [Terfezia claveryi]
GTICLYLAPLTRRAFGRISTIQSTFQKGDSTTAPPQQEYLHFSRGTNYRDPFPSFDAFHLFLVAVLPCYHSQSSSTGIGP